MLVGKKYIKPADFNVDNEVSKEYELYCDEFGSIAQTSTLYPYNEFKCTESGIYTFTLTSEEKELTLDIDIDVKGEISNDDLFITDGNGKILGLNSGYYNYDGCFVYSEIPIINIPEKIGDETITSIGDDAFAYDFGIKQVNIPSTVTVIGEQAFTTCSNLEEVNISYGVTSIGKWAFSQCEGLTNIIIPNSVVNIEEGAFWDCEDLTSITIPESVITIGDDAFWRCKITINIKKTTDSISGAPWGSSSAIINWDYTEE